MLKIVGITQRVDTISGYQEKRDAIDRRWFSLCQECHLLPVLLPNHLDTTTKLLRSILFNGFILSGGNTLQNYGGDAPERDKVEKNVLKYAIQNHLPLLGVCRGMQLIQSFFDIPLIKIKGHAKQEHSIIFKNEKRIVNSYHDYGTKETSPKLSVVARAEDDIIEAIEHQNYPVRGIMWHPERNFALNPNDKNLIMQLFQ